MHYACLLYLTKYKIYLITVQFSVYLVLDMGYIMQYLCYIINKIYKLYTMYDVMFYTFIFFFLNYMLFILLCINDIYYVWLFMYCIL